MRNIFAFIMVTVDGYYEGPNQQFDFWVVDEEFHKFSAAQLDDVDALVFGRVTYEGMAAYWPTAAAKEGDPSVAARMNSLPKVVVSRTLETAAWANTRIVAAAEELETLKHQPGKDMAILGSPNLTASLMQIGLLDELRIMVHPVVLGAGKSVFTTASDRTYLQLVKSRTFKSGSVLHHYRPASARYVTRRSSRRDRR